MDGDLRWLRRRFLVKARKERLAGPVYAAMVDSLFGTLVGFAALGIASILLAAVTFLAEPGPVTGVTLAVMVAIASSRAVLMISYHRWRQRSGGSLGDVVHWEIGYAILGVAMMLTIGSICAYNVLRQEGELALIVSVIITMGISGCIAGRNGSRPSIVRHQLVAVFTPFLAALVFRGNSEALAVLALILLFGFATMSSTQSVFSTLRSTLDAERRNRQLSQGIKRSAGLFDTALNNMTSGLLLFDRRRRLVVANEKVKILFGRELIDGMIGRPTYEICLELYAAFDISRRDSDRITGKFKQIMEEGGEDTLTVVDHRRRRTFEMRLQVMADGGVVFNVDDVTEQRAKDLEIYRLAHHDPLTGLPNRVSLARCLEERLVTTCDDEITVVMYLDLDRFKDVNDDLGHAAGDTVLVEVGKRLAIGIREGDFLARIAGDEFVFVFSSVREVSVIEGLATRLIDAVSAPCQVGSRQVLIGASVGLCVARYGEGAVEEALRSADVALYEAKLHGRGRAVWFNPAMDDRARARREMIVELRSVLNSGKGLALHYQPVFDVRSGRIIACEALMRWTHDVCGPIAPTVFIPLAEENGMICALGRWGLQRACADAMSWPDETMKVAVNVSGLQFQQSSVASVVREVLRETGLAANRLEIEITESVLADDLETMTFELHALAEEGVSIALDDFGTGFSSLSLLHKLPLDKVKLDRSFVAQLDEDPSAVNLIASIVQMTQVMRKQVVIEGVETASQLALINSANVRFVQGYYFSHPLTQDALIALLEQGSGEGTSAFKRAV